MKQKNTLTSPDRASLDVLHRVYWPGERRVFGNVECLGTQSVCERGTFKLRSDAGASERD